MFIPILGTRCSGKTIVEDYLVHCQGFTLVRLNTGRVKENYESPGQVLKGGSSSDPPGADGGHLPETENYPEIYAGPTSSTQTVLHFATQAALLDHVTRNWRVNFVTTDITDKEALEKCASRPFCLLLSIDAPLMVRYRRHMQGQEAKLSLEQFVQENDSHVYSQTTQGPLSSLHDLKHLINLHIINSFDSVTALHRYLDALNFLDPNRLRPHWDTYFMKLASLASHRSNCMKRRVGAVLVRDHRIVATGYNGTPRGVTNCNEGGCPRCNSGVEALDECLCLHAEENALLEAGRERVGTGAILYCNTCPCLKCTIKIIQTGVKEVIYNLSYKVDDASARLFEEAGIQLRRHAPPI